MRHGTRLGPTLVEMFNLNQRSAGKQLSRHRTRIGIYKAVLLTGFLWKL